MDSGTALGFGQDERSWRSCSTGPAASVYLVLDQRLADAVSLAGPSVVSDTAMSACMSCRSLCINPCTWLMAHLCCWRIGAQAESLESPLCCRWPLCGPGSSCTIASHVGHAAWRVLQQSRTRCRVRCMVRVHGLGHTARLLLNTHPRGTSREKVMH